MWRKKFTNDRLQFADFISDLVAEFDPNLRHTYVNSAVEHFTGCKTEHFLGKTNFELGMPPDLVLQWDEALEQVFRTGAPMDIAFGFTSPDGKRNFHSHLIPGKSPDGQVVSVVSIARDVTSDRGSIFTSELSLLEAERYRAILTSTDDAIVGKTLDGIVTSWNPAATLMFGYTAEEMLGRSVMILIPADRIEEENFIIERLLNGEKVDHFETVRVHKSGRLVYVSVTISPIRDDSCEIVGASKIARDITPLKVERERLQMALDATSNGLWDWDLKTGVVYRSDGYLKIAGYTRDDDTQDFKFFRSMVHPEDLAPVLTTIGNYRAGKSDYLEFEFRLLKKSGQTDNWMMARGQAVERDIDGLPSRIVGTLTDITQRKRMYASLLDREKQLSRVIEGSDQGYWDWNIQTNSLSVSQRWANMLGYAVEEVDVSNGRFEQYVHPEDFAAVMAAAQLHLEGNLPHIEAEIRCLTKSGSWAWIRTRGRVVEWDLQGNPLMVSGTHTDISERKIHEMSQRDATTVFDNSYEGIMVISPEGRFTRVNPAFTRITGYSAEDVAGKSPNILSSGRHDQRFFEEMYLSLAKDHFWTGEIWNRRKNGQIYAQLLSISTVVDSRNAVQHHIGIFSDISQFKKHEAELDRVAHYDALTGTPNRRLLADRMRQAIIRADRLQETIAICFLDLDGFKAVNDQYGHKVGDALLIGVTNNLKTVLRTDDTLSRLGGDEFAFLLENIGTPQECSLILERVLLAINTPVVTETALIQVSGSIGVSLYPQDHSDADTLFRHADQAMYRAKEAGKNRFHLFDLDSDLKAQYHREIIDRMHTALRTEEFRLYYQPKVDLSNGEIVGLEALIRWQHPEKGLLSPASFLQHVEGSTLDYPLGQWVMSSALKRAAQWKQQGQSMKVSINIGAHQLLHPDFMNDLRSALANHPDLPPEFLELEVLESVAISDIEQTVRVLHECHRCGVQIALDDFGTGYSSLTYLRKLPLDTLKIDQSFVREMLTDLEDHSIVEAVIHLASAFNRQVIAEGVETLKHGAALMQLGCKLAQGYGIARPMPEHEVQAWAREWAAQRVWVNI